MIEKTETVGAVREREREPHFSNKECGLFDSLDRENYFLLKEQFIYTTIEKLVNKNRRYKREKIRDSSWKIIQNSIVFNAIFLYIFYIFKFNIN